MAELGQRFEEASQCHGQDEAALGVALQGSTVKIGWCSGVDLRSSTAQLGQRLGRAMVLHG